MSFDSELSFDDKSVIRKFDLEDKYNIKGMNKL